MTNSTEPRYVVASTKPWHDGVVGRLQGALPGAWSRVRTPEELQAALAAPGAVRYVFFLHWSWIVPESVWSSVECVCFHMTDVPYGRGGSPLQNLIVRGHSETKVTALRMVAELDAGPVYAKRPLSLDGRAIEIFERLTQECETLIRWIASVEPVPVPQEGTPVLFRRRKPGESRLPEVGSLQSMYDHIRMLDAPTYPHAYLTHGAFRLEFTKVEWVDGELRAEVRVTQDRLPSRS